LFYPAWVSPSVNYILLSPMDPPRSDKLAVIYVMIKFFVGLKSGMIFYIEN